MRTFIARVTFTPETYLRAGEDPESVLVERIEQLGRELGIEIKAAMVDGESTNSFIEVVSDAIG